MNVRPLTISIPLLMLVYGVARWFDGRDGDYGPGAAWNIGHVAFLVAFVGFAALTIHFWRSSSHPHAGTLIANVASLVGVGLFLWVITTDLVPALDERASLPDPIMAVGPLIFIVGFVTSLAIHARQIGMKWWGVPPFSHLLLLWWWVRTSTCCPSPPYSSAQPSSQSAWLTTKGRRHKWGEIDRPLGIVPVAPVENRE